jgi:hypothetical protein
VDDVVTALVAIATRGTQPLYNVAGGINVGNAQLFARLGELSGRELRALRADRPTPPPVSRSSGCGRIRLAAAGPDGPLPALVQEARRADLEPRQPATLLDYVCRQLDNLFPDGQLAAGDRRCKARCRPHCSDSAAASTPCAGGRRRRSTTCTRRSTRPSCTSLPTRCGVRDRAAVCNKLFG